MTLARTTRFLALGALVSALTALPAAALSMGALAAADPAWFRDVAQLDSIENLLGPGWSAVIGRFHMALVHFPIGLLVAAGMVQLFAPNRAPRPGNSILVCLGLGTGAALLAAWTGWVHYEVEPLRSTLDRTVFLHRWAGVGVAGTSLIAFLFALIARKTGRVTLRRIYLLFLTLAVGGVLFAAHLGGTLTHGDGYLLRPLDWEEDETESTRVVELPSDPPSAAEVDKQPEDVGTAEPVRPELPVEEVPAAENDPAVEVPADEAAPVVVPDSVIPTETAAVSYEDVQRVLAASCLDCHNEQDPKAGLRLDTKAELLVWPELLSAGAPAESELIRRVSLPVTAEEHMPPNESLSAEAVSTLVSWIEAGCPGLE